MLNPRKSARGFTLIEIMVSLAVLGILLMVALPTSPAQTAWTVTEAGTVNVVQSRAHEEGSPNAQVTATPAGATTVTYAPLGSVVANLDGTPTVTQFDVSNPAGGSCQPGGPMRCLRVTISGGGSLRLCDPIVGVSDPRSC